MLVDLVVGDIRYVSLGRVCVPGCYLPHTLEDILAR